MPGKTITKLFLIWLVSLVVAGCANVKPYQREFLADPVMELNDGVMSSAYEQHMHRALSQGLIGMPVGSGGCGCEQ